MMECRFVPKRPNLSICYYKLLWSKCHIHGWPKITDRLNVTCDRATQFRDILTWTYNPSYFYLKVTVTLLSQCLKIPVHEKLGQNVTVDVCHQDVLSRRPIYHFTFETFFILANGQLIISLRISYWLANTAQIEQYTACQRLQKSRRSFSSDFRKPTGSVLATL